MEGPRVTSVSQNVFSSVLMTIMQRLICVVRQILEKLN